MTKLQTQAISTRSQSLCFVLVAAFFLGTCAKPASSDKKEGKKAAEPTKDATPVTPPDGTITPEDSAVACWDKLLKTPEALACTSLYTFSGKTCVAGLTKVEPCTRETVAASYGKAKINGGDLVMTSVDQWIADGYETNQCATGSDGKLYVYFLKKVFTSASASPEGAERYSIADKRLGPTGAILDSITLQTASAPTQISCD